MLSEIAPLLNELKRSRFYRGIVWAGGYPGFTPTPFSDIDLYAITASDHHHHWVAERFRDRRVELTFFSRPKWETVLKHDALHPKHHFTFMHGEIIHDPEGLCEEVRQIAFKTRWRFKATDDQIEHLRYILSIGKDKQRGFLSRGQMGHAHMAAVGNLFNSTELLCRRYGESGEGMAPSALFKATEGPSAFGTPHAALGLDCSAQPSKGAAIAAKQSSDVAK